MKHSLFLLIVLLATACSKPVANFVLNVPESIPSTLEASNTSTGADAYEWYYNGTKVSDSTSVQLPVIESGRHNLELRAKKGSKESIKSEEFVVDPPENCLVYMLTTEGELILELSEETLRHQNNFLQLVEDGFFKDISFHRVIDNFMIQAGDPKTKSKKPTKKYEELEEEIKESLIHVRGALAAARMPDNINPDKKSSGTQFYIVDGRRLTKSSIDNAESEKLFYYTEKQKEAYLENGGAPQLDGEYTVFGRLISGFETLDKISQTETDKSNRPLNEIKILEVKLIN